MERATGLFAAVLVCAAAEAPRGEVIPIVRCRADARKSYSLYLPSNYAADRQWPMLYCFDPGARGRAAVDRFRTAAEEYGYIVAGSNDSRNGPMQPSLEAIAAVWEDTHERFRIDARRTYAAGMSGGARLVSRVAAGTKLFAGVILCSAGLSQGLKPAELPCPVFATAGTDDFNYFELRRLDRDLDGTTVAHRLVVFEGPHDWPPTYAARRALEWLELIAMQRGLRPRDDKLIEAASAAYLARGLESERNGDVQAAYDAFAAAAIDLRGLTAISTFEAKAAELSRSPQVNRARKREQQEAAEHERLMRELLRPERDEEHAPARHLTDALRKESESDDPARRRVARRAMQGAFAVSYESMRNALETRNFSDAARWLELMRALRPGRPLLDYQAACAYGLAGDRQRARQALKRAFDGGLGYCLFFASSRI